MCMHEWACGLRPLCESDCAVQHCAGVHQQAAWTTQCATHLQRTVLRNTTVAIPLPPGQDMGISTNLVVEYILPLSEAGMQNHTEACRIGQEQAEQLMREALVELGFTGSRVRAVCYVAGHLCATEPPHIHECTRLQNLTLVPASLLGQAPIWPKSPNVRLRSANKNKALNNNSNNAA